MGFPRRLKLNAGEHDRNHTPVSVVLDEPYDTGSSFALKEAATGKSVPCQTEPCDGKTRLAWLADGLGAHDTREYDLTPGEAAPDAVVLMHDEAAKEIAVTVGGGPFTTYHYSNKWVRPFLFPLFGPGGKKVTRSYPVATDVEGESNDHPHHKSVWVAHGECDDVDNWSEQEGHGWQRHRELLACESGPVFGRLMTRNDWMRPDDATKQFEETRELRFYALPGGTRLIEFTIRFHMSEGEVTFRDTKEGGILSVRVASEMDVPRTGRIVNGYGGTNEDETWGKKAPWCDYSGTVEGKPVGIAVFDHEDNPRYPTNWHVRNYGLMTANPFGLSYFRPDRDERGDMVFPAGSTTAWRYRLYVHEGDAVQACVAERFMDFAAPPKAAPVE